MEFRSGGKSKTPPKKKKAIVESVDDTRLPMRIEVSHKGAIQNTVPGHVWRTPKFKWDPCAFATEAEQLNAKVFEPSTQDKSLIQFMDNPAAPMIFGVSGNPDDSKAKYFAAYLVDLHMKHLGVQANPVWATMYSGFDNPYMNNDAARPTLLVLSNLTPNSTTLKLEKTRDLIEANPDIPRIVVCAGMDPVSFLTTRLHVPVNGMAYFAERLVKAKIEII